VSGENERPVYRLVNSCEDAVRLKVAELINKDPDMCKCEKCFLDVCAIVINGGFCHIVTTTEGELLANIPNIMNNSEADLFFAAFKAIEIVKNHPMH